MRVLPYSIRFCVAALAFAIAALHAQDPDKAKDEQFSQIAEGIDTDLKTALEELATVRALITKEKPEISAEANQIAAELRDARRKADIARASAESIEQEFSRAEADLKTWRDEKIYLESLLFDFQKTYEASRSLARKQEQRQPQGTPTLDDKFQAAEEALEVLGQAGLVSTFSGEAVSEVGVFENGTVVAAGPVQWFLPEAGNSAGIIKTESDLRAGWVPRTVSRGEVEKLIGGSSAYPTVDPTLGSALSLAETETGFLARIKQGGFWIFPILLLAAIALIAAIAKWTQLAKIRGLASSRVQVIIDLVRSGEKANALNECVTISHPAGRILHRGVTLAGRDRDDLEEGMFETFLEEQPALHRGLPFIAIASATAPLLGLLGTVTGMIETFRLINLFGTGDARNLASGISEALVTTEFGLIVAIPALILHALLSRKVQGIKATMEMVSLAFLNGIGEKDNTSELKSI